MTRMDYGISYRNTKPLLSHWFIKDMKLVYRKKAYKTKSNQVAAKGKWLYQRLKKFGAGKSRDWFIGDEILTAEKSIIREWLRAFFDNEAFVELRKIRISIDSVNPDGLRQVQELLKKMGVNETSFTGPYLYKKSDIYRLSILKEDVERFAVYVGFSHPKRAKALEELLDLRALTL